MPAGNDAKTRNVITPRLGLITPARMVASGPALVAPRLG